MPQQFRAAEQTDEISAAIVDTDSIIDRINDAISTLQGRIDDILCEPTLGEGKKLINESTCRLSGKIVEINFRLSTIEDRIEYLIRCVRL